MIVGDKETDGLEKLLADVQRTIRENDQFIRNLTEEAASDGGEAEEEPDGNVDVDDRGYEEL